MYNALTKFIATAAVAALAASCSGNAEKEAAQNLCNEAQTAVETADYARALTLIDSLNNAYPRQIDIRRQAMHLGVRANEGLAVARLQSADSLAAVLEAEATSLEHTIEFIKNPVEGYYVAKGVKPSAFTSTDGLQARLSPDGDIYLLSSLKSRKVNSTRVVAECDGNRAETAVVAHDGERNDRSMGSEVITFMGVECDSIVRFITENADRPIRITFSGDRDYTMTLPKAQADEIATVTRYGSVLRKFKGACVEREKQRRIIDTARAQAARTYVEPDSVK